MLFVYHGTSVTETRTAALKKAHDLCGRDSEVTFFLPEKINFEMLRDALGAVSLFRSNEVYVLDTLTENPELFERVLELAPEMGTSKNHFILIESSLPVRSKKVLEGHATECKEYTEEKRAFDPFALGDALVARDRKTLWILLTEAWREGRTSEEILGTLWWQLKMIRLGKVAGSAVEAGQKPFVYDKAKRALKNYKTGEIEKLSHDLLMLYHEGHSGKWNIDHALEAWTLRL